ncbi:hypothetical protein F4777DRAFT_581904 [Nemania sp. FL0916]|nr:hypothetical protein F4777DRAFT_581904 [Nemania sp. FL0916]
MRPTSLFVILAGAAYSLPVRPFKNSLLDNIQDLIFGNVGGGIFPYNFGGFNRPSCFTTNFDSKVCVAQCQPSCTGNAQSCSDCLLPCYRQNSCYGGNRGGNDQNTPPPPPPPPAAPAPAPTPSPTPEPPAQPEEPANPDDST